MGVIQVPGRLSGRTYNVNISGDAPTEKERARIIQEVQARESKFIQKYEQQFGKPAPEPEDGTALGRGFELGKAGAYSRLGTATEYLGSGLGLESVADFGRGMRESGDQETFLETLRQPAPTQLEDVKGLGNFLTYAGEGIGQSGPEMLAPLAASGIGLLVGSAASLNPAAGVALGMGAGAVTAFPSFFGGNIQRQEAEVSAGRKAEVDVSDAVVSAIGQSALNSIGDKLLLGGFVKAGQKWLTRTAVGVGEGVAVEIPTEITQQIIERKQAGLPLDDDEAIKEYVNAGVLGGIMGGGIRGATAGLGIGVEKETPPPATTPIDPATLQTQTEMELTPSTRPGFVSGQKQGELFLPTATPPTGGSARPAIAAPTVTPAGGSARPATTATAPDSDAFDIETTLDALRASDGLYPKAMADLGVPYSELTKRVRHLESKGLVALDRASGKMTFPEVPKVEQTVTLPEATAPTVIKPAATPKATKKAQTDALNTLQKARVKQNEGSNQLVTKAGAQRLADVGLVNPEDLAVPAMATAKVNDLLALGPDEVKKRMQVAELKVEEPQATPPNVEVAGADWLKEGIAFNRELADRRDITGKIEDLFATGLTAGQVRTQLQKDGNLTGIDNADQQGFVVGVRASLGIPSQLSQEGKAEFQDWLGGYKARKAPTAAPTAAPQAAPQATPTGLDVGGVDEAISQGVGNISVTENGQTVPFDKFALSVDGNKAEVGFVERAKGARKGIGYDAYLALGEKLAQRGIQLQSSQTKLGPGQNLWKKLEENGYAKLNPQTKRLEFVPQAARVQAAPQDTIKSDVVSEFTVGPEGLTVVHGGKPGLTVEGVQIIRPANQMKQGKKGSVFGGFYATREADAKQAEGYAGSEGKLYNVQILPGTRVAQRGGSIERLSEQTINQYVADGYGVVYGKDVRGRTEFVVVDKNAILDLSPRGAQATAEASSIPEGNLFGKKVGDGSRATGTAEPNTLAPEEPATPAFIPPYDAGTGAARQLIPGTITTVDPRTLQPTGKTRFEDSDVYAPSRDIPESEPALEPARTVLTGSPTELQIRDVLRPLKTARDEREIAAEAEANSAAQSELAAEWDVRMASKPELASLSIEYSTPDAVVKEDPTTSQDKQKILTLLRPGGYKRGKDGQAPAQNAYNYFSRFKRPIDAIEFIVADVELKNQRFKTAESEEKQLGLLGGGDEMVNAAERMFFSGMTQERAKEALKWVEANMSPQAQVKVRELRQMYKKAEETKVPNKVTSSLASSTAIGGRSANLEERQIFEQELVVQATEATANKVADTELAVVATTAAGDAAKLAAAARENVKRVNELLAAQTVANAASAKKGPSKAASVPMPLQKPRNIAGMTKNKQIELTTDYIVQALGSNSSANATPLNFNRAEDVRDLDLPLHPAVINALRNGNLELALRTLELYAPNARVKRIANVLAPYAKGVSVRLVDNLYDSRDGKKLRGQYRRINYGARNEILLDSVSGTDVMVLLHEMTHAATVKELLNKASPMRKRIETLLNQVKPRLSTNNGPDLDIFEFVAEAFTNPRFQSELSRIYPDGGRFPALWRFANEAMNLVRRLLGLPPRQISNALDMSDQMIMGILDFPVSPTDISNPQGAATILNKVAAIDGSFPARTKEFGQQFGDDASRVLDGASYGAKRTVLGFMNSQGLADVAGHFKVSGARDLQNAIDQHDAAAIKSDSEVDVVLDIAQKWTKNNPSLKPKFDRLVSTSTIEQSDPSLTRDAALKKYGADSEKMRQYDAMQADWTAIGDSGHDLYNNMRQLYRKQYERLREALAGKLDFILSDNPELAADIKKSVYTKFFSMNAIEPYFPLAREGDFWLEYTAFDPETKTTESVRETYTSPNERTRAIKELESMPGVVKGPDGKPTISIYSSLDLAQQGRTPDSLFVRDILAVVKVNLAKTGVDAATSDSIQQEITKLFVSALPETSFAKSLQRRKNVRGFMEDSVNALRVKGYSLGRQGVRYGYSNKIRAIADGIAQQAKKTNDQSKIAVIAELAARAEFAVNPPNTPFERAVQTANRTAFTFLLGFNVSAAIVNLSSISVVLYPYLSGRYGARSSFAAIFNAYKVFINSGLSREIELPAEFQGKRTSTVRAMPSIDNYFVLKEKRTVGADGKDVVTQEYVIRDDIPAELRPALQELATLVDVASKNGQLNRSIYYDSIGAEDVGRARNFSDRFSAISGAMFHQVERANRQVALVAAYNLELARLRNKPRDSERGLSKTEQRTRAAERAVYQATETGGAATLAAAPRFAQKGIGRVALMFKNFGLSLFYMQMKLLKQLTVGSNDPDFTPEDRRVAFKQLVGLQLSSFALAGVSGVPLYGLVSMIADAFLGEDEEDADSLTRKYIGEGFYKGFLTEISGLDISSRIGLTGLLIRENRYNTDASAEETLVANLGGPAWSTVTQAGRGVSEFYSAMTGGEGDMVRGIENMVPAAFRNFLKAGRYIYDGGDIETRRKDIITGDLGSSDLLGQALGFTPTKATLAQDLNQLTVRISNAVVEKRSRLSKLYYIAMRVGDIDGAREAMEDIRAFNKDVAQRFPEAVIDSEFLKESLKSHQRTSKEMSSGVTLNPVVREELEVMKSMYNQGMQLF